MRECFENLSTKNHVGQQILLFENNGVGRDCFFSTSQLPNIFFSLIDLK